jgi:hypothetical protein
MQNFTFSLIATAALCFSVQTNAQCEPDFDFGEAEWGASPDATAGEQFDTAYVFTPYADVFHVLVPTDASAIDPLFALPLDSVVLMSTILVDTVSQQTIALEDIGLEIVCNNLGSSPNPCTLISGEQYCASLEGTPTLAGVYQMTLMVEAYVTVFGVPVAQPYEFSGYILDVLNIPFGIDDSSSKTWNVYPNPTSNFVNISGLGRTGTITVIDITGRTVLFDQLNNLAENAKFDVQGWSEGLYFIQVLSDGKRSTRRLIIQH